MTANVVGRADLLASDTHCFRILGKTLLYVVPTREIFHVEDVVFDLFQELGRDSVAAEARLRQNHPADMVELAFEEVDRLADHVEQHLGALSIEQVDGTAFRPVGMRLNVAHACNLACVYCYAQHGDYGKGAAMMSPEVAERSIDFLLEHALETGQETLGLEFFGGEPLLNPDVVRHTVEYAQHKYGDRGVHLGFTITTNGTLLSDELLDLFAGQEVGVAITLDGDGSSHDRTRPYRGNGGSFDQVYSTIRRLQDRGVGVVVNSTLTEISPSYVERYRCLRELGLYGFRILPVAPYQEDGTLRTYQGATPMGSLQEYAEHYLSQLEEGNFDFDCYLSPRYQLFKNLIRHVLFRSQTSVTHGCGAGCNQVGISPEGDLYPCYMFVGVEEWKIGHVSSGLDHAKRLRFLERFRQRKREQCSACWARYQCSGGCYKETYDHDLMLPQVPIQESQRCQFTKRALELALAIYAEFEDRPDVMEQAGWTRYQPRLDSNWGQRQWHQDKVDLECGS